MLIDSHCYCFHLTAFFWHMKYFGPPFLVTGTWLKDKMSQVPSVSISILLTSEGIANHCRYGQFRVQTSRFWQSEWFKRWWRKKSTNPQVDLSTEQLDQPGCSKQDTPHAGARRLIQALIQLNCSTESSDEERDENDGGAISTTFLYVNDSEETAQGKKMTKNPNEQQVKWRKTKYQYQIMNYSELAKKDHEKAMEALDLYNDEKYKTNVHMCGLYLKGKCGYTTKISTNMLCHMKCHREKNIPLPLKIVNYPGFKDKKTHEYIIKTYSQLQKEKPGLAKKVLALYKDPKNKNKSNVHLCLKDKCEYLTNLRIFFNLDNFYLISQKLNCTCIAKYIPMEFVFKFPPTPCSSFPFFPQIRSHFPWFPVSF